jgi:hypothetical protein
MDYKAFVSSTFLDLNDHRAHVIRELRKAGFFVDPMEEWTSAAQSRCAGIDQSARRLQALHPPGRPPPRPRAPRRDAEHHATGGRRGPAPRYRRAPFLLDDDALWKTELDERGTDAHLRPWRADIQWPDTKPVFDVVADHRWRLRFGVPRSLSRLIG